MNTVIELTITLTRTSSTTQPEHVAVIDLRCDALGLFHTGDILLNPLTNEERFELQWYLDEYWQWPFEGFAERGRKVENLLPMIGKKLFDAVFNSLPARDVMQMWRLQAAQPKFQGQISIVSDIPIVLSLPWELLHDEHGYIVLRTQKPVTVVRRLRLNQIAALLTPFVPPLRILLVTARPDDTGFVDPRGIARELFDELEEQINIGNVHLEILRPPTLSALRKRLVDTTSPIHVLHFDGHGIFAETSDPQLPRDEVRLHGGKRGMLAFEDDQSKLNLVSVETLAQVLQDSRIKLAVLTACQSAVGGEEDVYSSVAARLIKGGVDAVVAMSASVLSVSAARFSEAFYCELGKGVPVTVAQERARQALHDDSRRHILRRSRDEPGNPVHLQDWWLPHLYLQRPITLQPRIQRRKSGIGLEASKRLIQFPQPPKYGWSGRTHELLQIERNLLRNRLVVVHGFGGVGKTALVQEAADWLTRTRLYETAIFISFEHGGNAPSLLSVLGHHLEVYDSNYNPYESMDALIKLRVALKERSLLVIIDNIESVLPDGEVSLDKKALSQLWTVLLALKEEGVGVLLTSRYTKFGDDRLASGQSVIQLRIGGLTPDDAYSLASRILDYLHIDRKHVPYNELRLLLAELDHHPLAIQLVLPVLQKVSLKSIRMNFAELMPLFTDDTISGRNRSLTASLEYSIQCLGSEQRETLTLLAPFESGAIESNIIGITHIPNDSWNSLRSNLEQLSLVRAEQLGPNNDITFLYFHPVLTPYLRSIGTMDGQEVVSRFAEHYREQAHILYYADWKNRLYARHMFRLELPNFRKALDIFLDTSNITKALEIEHRISTFLDYFGMIYERDSLTKRMENYHFTSKDEILSNMQYLREVNSGEGELRRGRFQDAYERFSTLLTRIESQDSTAEVGPSSVAHSVVLFYVAQCLYRKDQSISAEQYLHRALAIIEAEVLREGTARPHVIRLVNLRQLLVDIFIDQGKYEDALAICHLIFETAKEEANLELEQMILQKIKLIENKHMLGRSELTDSQFSDVDSISINHDPKYIAEHFEQLGAYAENQERWSEAENYYKQSLMILEVSGDLAGANSVYVNLGILASRINKWDEALEWFRRSLKVREQLDKTGPSYANSLNNLANCIEKGVRVGQVSTERLLEAYDLARQALRIFETAGETSGIWSTFGILADISQLSNDFEQEKTYRCRERETFAAFPGNRYRVNKGYRYFIIRAATVANGDSDLRKLVEEQELSKMVGTNWECIPDIIKRIWEGERDWHGLCTKVQRDLALVIKCLLEEIEHPSAEQMLLVLGSVSDRLPQLLHLFPNSLKSTFTKGDLEGVKKSFEALPLIEQNQVMQLLYEVRLIKVSQSQCEEDELMAIQQRAETTVAKVLAKGNTKERADLIDKLVTAAASFAAGEVEGSLRWQLSVRLRTLAQDLADNL